MVTGFPPFGSCRGWFNWLLNQSRGNRLFNDLFSLTYSDQKFGIVEGSLNDFPDVNNATTGYGLPKDADLHDQRVLLPRVKDSG
jgi:hypothetical protein